MPAGIYFRRWTRMYYDPAIKYFHRYGVLQPGYEQFLPMMNHVDPAPENRFLPFRRSAVDRDAELNEKLMKNLFLKYPDLKYESINRLKYEGDGFNSYSYAFSFITEQKKLIKAGYTIAKAFQIVEQKFHARITRKMDQTLMARGLAIGNRARSFLTIYQQQAEYQARLKMLRTKRQVLKYEKQLQQVQKAINSPVDNEKQNEGYERVFQKISEDTSQTINQDYSEQKRYQMIDRLQHNFDSTFSQFYQRAAYKDRLHGLTDEQIKQQIMLTPQKIKRQTRELIKFLQRKGGVFINKKGEIKLGDALSQKTKAFILSSPSIKTAIYNDLLNYESPHEDRNPDTGRSRAKLNQLQKLTISTLGQQQKKTIHDSKLKNYQIAMQSAIPNDKRIYKLFESEQQRLLRLEIKYYQTVISRDKLDKKSLDHIKQVVEKFRRLKFRTEKRYQRQSQEELAYPEHYQLEDWAEIEKDAEYEELLEYLKKKTEERRLRMIDQVDDDKISGMVKDVAYPEMPESEGDLHTT